MRDFSGIPFSTLPDPKEPDFTTRLRNALSTIDAWARDASAAMRRIQNGEKPSGSGEPLGASDINPKGYGAVDEVAGDYLSKSEPADQSVLSQVEFKSGLTIPAGILQTDNVNIYLNNSDILSDGMFSHSGQVNFEGGDLNVGATGDPWAINHVGSYNQSNGTAYVETLDIGGSAVRIDSSGVYYRLPMQSDTTGNVGYLVATNIGNGQEYYFPGSGGELLSTNATQTLNNKTVATSCSIRVNSGSGATFQDNTTTSKQMRFDLSGYAASTTRTMKWSDISGTPVLVGNTTSASGTLGISDLTAQTGSVGSTTLMTGTTATAGMYRVSCYLKCTTAGTAGTVKVTVSFDDGTAQTKDIPLVTTAGVGATLSLTTLNGFEEGHVVVYSQASKNITYTTTVTGATGSPQYTVRVRIEKL